MERVASAPEVPALEGHVLQDARDRLDPLGVQVRTIFEYSSQPVNVVLEQAPPTGTSIRAGETVILTVSKGPEPSFFEEFGGGIQDAFGSTLSAASASTGTGSGAVNPPAATPIPATSRTRRRSEVGSRPPNGPRPKPLDRDLVPTATPGSPSGGVNPAPGCVPRLERTPRRSSTGHRDVRLPHDCTHAEGCWSPIR